MIFFKKNRERIKLSKKSHTNESNPNDYLVDSAERFSFDDVKGGKVEFVNYSIVDPENIGQEDKQIFRQYFQ